MPDLEPLCRAQRSIEAAGHAMAASAAHGKRGIHALLREAHAEVQAAMTKSARRRIALGLACVGGRRRVTPEFGQPLIDLASAEPAGNGAANQGETVSGGELAIEGDRKFAIAPNGTDTSNQK